MMQRFIFFGFLMLLPQLLHAQTNSDDYWLGNGFNDGGTVITNSGWFYDDGGDDVYHQNQNWEVEFCSENGNPITLDFSNFKTHYGGPLPSLAEEYRDYDYLWVDYPGGNYVVYHDDTPEFSFTSQNGCISFGFISDNDGQIDSGWVAEIYALPPPFNNDPEFAEELVVGNVCSPSFYTNKGAYSTTSLGNAPCKEFFGGDVWFRLTVPASGEVRIETFPGTLSYAILDIFSSTNSTILDSERIACVDDAGAMPAVTLSSPTVSPGETIYIRLFGEQAKSGLFGICASDPVAPVTGYTGPGGVGDSISIDLWCKSDTGVLNASGNQALDAEAVRIWQDQSGNNNHLVQTLASSQASYEVNVLNGFGALDFDGFDDLYAVESGSGDAPLHWFAAGAFSGSARQSLVSVGDAFSNRTASLSRYTDGRYFSFSTNEKFGPALSDEQFYVFHSSYSNSAPYHALELNGASQLVDAFSSPLESDGSLQLGASWDDSDPFNGYISELIQYSRALNEAQEIIVNNYLAAKYDLTLTANDYYEHTNTYYFDVAGIGQIDADNTHTKAESAGILALSGADDLDNGEFLLFGHDNADFSSWQSSNVPAGDTNIVRLSRTWRVDLTGDPGAVSISLEKASLPALPADFSAYNILIDNDGDFTSGSVSYGLFDSGSELVINDVVLNDDDYLSIVAIRPLLSFVSANSSALESLANPQIEVQLNYAVSEVVTVAYTVSGGTALQGTDYSLGSSTLSIDPGTRSAYIIPLIFEDNIAEIPDEYFDIEISTPTAGISMGSISTARHTILNNDLEVNIIASDTIIGACPSSVSELVALPVGTGPFTFSWTPVAGLNVADNDTVLADPSFTSTYTVEVSDGFGQTATKDVQIEVRPIPLKPLISINGSSSICSGDSVQLSAPAGYSAYIWSSGESTESVWLTATGSRNLIVIDSFGCSSPVSDDVSITVNPLPDAPSVILDGPAVFCDGDSVILIAEAGYSSYLWSDMSINDSLNVQMSGQYFVAGRDANGCLSQNSDTVLVSVLANPAQPLISSASATTFCAGDSVQLSAPAGFTDYFWNNGSKGQMIYVTSTGNYDVYVEDANGCISIASEPLSVTVNALPLPPVISGSGPLSFCDGGSTTLQASGSYVLYTWTDGTTGQNRVVESSGEYAVKVRDGNACESDFSDTTVVTEYPLPSKPAINVEGELAFCEGDSVLLIAPAGSAGYLWSDGSGNDSLWVTGSGSYTVSVTDINGCDSPVSEPVVVTVYAIPAKPEITADGPLVFCAGDSVKLSAPAGQTSYLWSNSASSESIYISQSTTVELQVKNENGCSSLLSDPVLIVVNSLPDAPSITADGPLVFCDGGSVTLESSGSFAGYEWSDGTPGKTRLVVESGDYTVKVIDDNSCESAFSEALTVSALALPDAPVLTLTGTEAFCEGDSLIISAPAGFAVYEWSDGSAAQELIVKTAGTYSVNVTDDNTCTSPESELVETTVNALPAAPVLSAAGATEFCEGGSVELNASPGYLSYIWSDGGSGQDRTVNTTVQLSVIGEDANSCLSPESNIIEVKANPIPDKPVITADGPLMFLTGDSVTLSAPLSSAYLWSPGAEEAQDLVVKLSGAYSVIVENEFGCQSVSSDVVDVISSDFLPSPLITVNGSLQFCEGENVELSGPEGYALYRWSNGSEGKVINVTVAGLISLIVEDADGHESLPSEAVDVFVYDLPQLSLGNSVEPLCFGESSGSISVLATGGLAPYTFEWEGSDQSGEELVSVGAGAYRAIVTDVHLCTNDLEITLDEPAALEVEALISPAFCPDFSDGEIELEITGGTYPYTVSWSGGSNSEMILDLAPGTYSYEVNDANNCLYASTVELTYENEVCFRIPEIITPNNDSYNDNWYIEGLEVYPDVTIELFDRWGKRVFYSEGHDVYFDGTFNGKDLPMESYHYIIDLHNGSEKLIGNLTIIR